MRFFALARKRITYVGRLLYWSVRHCSISRALWVLDYEGTTWN